MATRMIDRNAHRWGAGISAVVLYAGLIFDAHWIAPLLAVVFVIGVVFGLRYSPLGAAYRLGKSALKLNVPVLPEEEMPPRFAQLMGLIFTVAATFAFYSIENAAAGWTLTLIVAALQTLLAATGLCIGCEVYLIGKRFSARTAA